MLSAIALVLTVCHGTACHDVRLPLNEDATVLQCQSVAQAMAAAWMANYPAFKVTGLWCDPGTATKT